MIFVLIGIVVYLIGSIGLLIDEFKESIAWGLLGLFTQIGHLIFSILHFDKCKRSLGLILLGIILVFAGVVTSANTQSISREQSYEFQQSQTNDAEHPAVRKEYRAGNQMPVGSRVAAPVCEDWPETGYWLSTNSNKRHNKKCENYRKTRGYPCKKNEGQPCGKCGG